MARYLINEKIVQHNINTVLAAADSFVIAVVKGNGYGFGLEWMARTAYERGIRTFAVTEPTDIPLVRSATSPESDILLLRSTALASELDAIVAQDGIATLGSTNAAKALEEVAATRQTRARAHIKVDIGLGRYGFFPDQLDEIAACYQLPHVNITGIYGHFSQSAAWQNRQQSLLELSRFDEVIEALNDRGIAVEGAHLANSPGLFNIPEAKKYGVRIGSAFTGRVNTAENVGLLRAGRLEAPIIETKFFPRGTPLGYGGNFKTTRDTQAAIIPTGTHDGWGMQVTPLPNFHTVLSSGKRLVDKRYYSVDIKGHNYPVLGSVDMSLALIDITDAPVAIGDIAAIDINPLMVASHVERVYL